MSILAMFAETNDAVKNIRSRVKEGGEAGGVGRELIISFNNGKDKEKDNDTSNAKKNNVL